MTGETITGFSLFVFVNAVALLLLVRAIRPKGKKRASAKRTITTLNL